MPAVDRGVRAIARGADGCPVELTGEGILAQGPGGAYIADGSATKPLCLPALIPSNTPNALLGLTNSAGSLCYRSFVGAGSVDTNKVVKWDGTAFVLKPLLESLCYPASIVQNTCCPTQGLAVWGQSGSSLCLQQWSPCEDQTQKSVSNPKFVGCEDGGMVAFSLCDLPDLTAGTEYQTVVCTADGPRVLGASSGDIATRQFIPFDVLGSGTPLVLANGTYNESNGASISIPIDLAGDSGVAIPDGATHVWIIVNVVGDNDDDGGTLSFTTYSPATVTDANKRGFLSAGNDSNDFDSSSYSFTVPISAGGVSVLIAKSGSSGNWDLSVFIRVEGYWVG